MSLLPKLPGTLAALGMLLLVAFAPSVALAHAGHLHADRGHVGSIGAQAVSASADERALQELRSADVVAKHAQQDHDCADRGCCGNGHCAGCCNALAPSGLAGFSPLAKSMRVTLDAAVPPGLGTSGPPRPPRTFV